MYLAHNSILDNEAYHQYFFHIFISSSGEWVSLELWYLRYEGIKAAKMSNGYGEVYALVCRVPGPRNLVKKNNEIWEVYFLNWK